MQVSGSDAEEIAESAELSNKTILQSPLQEWYYLIGLLMSTDDLSNGKNKIKNDSDFEKLEKK
ncbi:MAG: hypothetical protein IKP77_01025 [Acholeplasmatales bacterium]|nr:hypothetical protein [Acholeplasmatales bacterium]